MELLDSVLERTKELKNVELIGLHFHIGSQITETEPFESLSNRINELQDNYEAKGYSFKIINVGGGLGIDYKTPVLNPIHDFTNYFPTFN